MSVLPNCSSDPCKEEECVVLALVRACMQVSCLPSMSGVAARECAGSFSSVSSNTAREVEEEFLQHQQQQFHTKPLVLGSPPEMGNDDGDLQRVTGPSELPPPAPPTVKKKRSLPGTPGACILANP